MNIVEISARENFGLYLRYEDGTQGVVDLSSLAGHGVFAAWMQPVEWATLHQEELREAFRMAEAMERPAKIEPLP